MLFKIFQLHITLSYALVVCMLITVSECYPYFQQRLPNGNNVPHPCINGYTWQGVGHDNPRGAGPQNVFGVDFKNNHMKWDAVICNKDSDGDGRTNGEELGDPDCTWTPDANPKYTSGLSHPGICEPIESPRCGRKPSFVDCQAKEKFQCDAINEPDTFNFTVRFPETSVPAQETTYICITFELPMDNEYHLVATVPYIDNIDVLHHTIVYGCEGADEAPGPLMETMECGGEMNVCREVISAWTVGLTGDCIDRNMGFLVGGNKGLKYAMMQHHWNNPQEMSHYTDSSGMTFYLTPNLRQHNAGMFLFGQGSLDIPPRQSYYSASGFCDSGCLSQIMDGNIYVPKVLNHMHLLGTAQNTELRRNTSIVVYLAQDSVYDYNAPVYHIHSDPVMIHPGDELKTTCIFNSKSRAKTTNFGISTSDEMCLAYLAYYPKENMRTGECYSWKSLGHCEMRHQAVIRGCEQSKMFNPYDPDRINITETVNALCEPGKCRQECFDYVKELKRHSCFAGDVGQYLRTFSIKNEGLERIVWYARLDSCDVKLRKEECGDISAGYMVTSLYAILLSVLRLILSC